MKLLRQKVLFYALLVTLITSCGTTRLVSTPIENIDNTPLKFNEITKAEEKVWGHLDLVSDTIPGMSVNKAYKELIKNKKGTKVIVAVIDSGIDIDHEDLDDVIWTNKDEIPNNNKDDDNNGYIDDIHGWNFLGEAYQEQLEYVRLLASGNKSHPRYAEAEAEYQKKLAEYTNLKSQYTQILPVMEDAHKTLSDYFKKPEYSEENINALKTEDKTLQQSAYAVKVLAFDNGFDKVPEAIDVFKDNLKRINEMLNYNLNKNFNGRKVVGDNPDDFTDINYGNNNVKPIDKSETHGTHVAGIIAAERYNEKGVNGIANNVLIMPIRAVSNGDEYDKDIALAIRYAVDNGAKIINASFGKYYSPHSDKVKEALVYASAKDVLFVHASGNEGLDIDKKTNFPNDLKTDGSEIINSYLSVGATEQKYGSGLVASYSNYGKNNVDVFAPGSNIYSTYPNNTYKAEGGTSMAAPAVAGLAALIRSYYPKLTAAQVKQVIMDSGLSLKAKVTVGENSEVKPFGELSKSGKLVNVYNALIMASKIAN
ncbi:MAG: S8 family peptidase [Flavobacteriaceae bacterium]|nr:S8 family peptidase [Flavobacteriaceae bacterium]